MELAEVPALIFVVDERFKFHYVQMEQK